MCETTNSVAAFAVPGDLRDRAGKYLIFHLGTEEFGMEVEKVQEIVGLQEITAVPRVPEHIRGVINLRGKVISVVDLRLKLGMATQDYTSRTCIIVVRTYLAEDDLTIGMIVDGVDEVLNLTGSDIEDAPDFGAGVVTPSFTGIAKAKDKVMSLFIVLWLLNTSPQVKKAVAGYFNDPRSNGRETGTKTLGAGESISIDKQNVEKLKAEIEKAILKQADLTKLSKQIDITVTEEGLKIELIEDRGGTFFESGSPKLSDNGVALLTLLSAQLKTLPNRLLIEGHTDAQPYSSITGYTNWELSSDRANSARRLLQQGGIGPSQISRFADTLISSYVSHQIPWIHRIDEFLSSSSGSMLSRHRWQPGINSRCKLG